jgi:type IV pilus assembly protein PilW
MSSAPASIRTTDPARGMLARPRVGQPAPWPRARGISLIELMIGMTIGLIALLVMMQTFSASNAHKSNTVSGADATTAGHIAMTLIERELLNAGSGFGMTQCAEIRQYGPSGTLQSFSHPVTIEANTSAGTLNNRSDRITIRSGEASTTMGSSQIVQSMPNPAATLFGNNATGFAKDDLILLYEPGKACVLLQLTQAPGESGGRWRFNRNPSSPYNPSGQPEGFFPSGGFGEGTGRILSLGPLGITTRQYSLAYRSTAGNVPNSDLQAVTPAGSVPIARDVVALRAQYGWWDSTTKTVSFSSTVKAGAGPTDLAAVRVGIVVRASQRDPSYTAPTDIKLFEYDNPITISLSGDELRYRYRSYETVVPLRNTLWNRN